MQANSADYARRMAAARRIVSPEKTVAVLMDSRPGFDPDAAREIICGLRLPTQRKTPCRRRGTAAP